MTAGTERTLEPGWPCDAAIVGAGTMGLGVAEVFAVTGLTVRLTDALPELARQGRARLAERMGAHVAAGLLPTEALVGLDRVTAIERLPETVVGADLVFEAVPERLALKHDVLAAIAAAAGPSAIIATNTSSLPIDELATAVTHPARFLGMHWFNPPEWIPGVEIVPGTATAPEIVTRVHEFLTAIGKRPAVVRSSPGFVANRIQNALFREAVACVEEGLASPDEVDEVVRGTFGFRLPFFGPFQIADMAGLDVYANVFETFARALGEAWRAPSLLRAKVDEGNYGTKTGSGFYQYTPEEREQLLLERDRRYAALSALLAELPPLQPNASESTATGQG